MDAHAILEHIGRFPHGRATYKQLIRELGVRGDQRRDLERLLAGLVERGRLIETRSGHYVLAERQGEYVSGKLVLHRDGYGFVIPDQPQRLAARGAEAGTIPDIYVSAESAAGAMHGDRVLVRLKGPSEGRLVRILSRAHAEVVGQFHYSRRGSYVVPYDEKIRDNILIPRGAELPPPSKRIDRLGEVRSFEITSPEDLEGAVVNVEITSYPSAAEPAQGRVTEVLGQPDDFGVDVEIMIRKHHLPHEFPPEVIAQARAIPHEIPVAELAKRRDFRRHQIVTIDGETARDFDDAVWVEQLPNGRFALQVHIADVSHYVRPGMPIDHEALLRGTSVYFPDRAVPMLPVELSTDICSLRPQEDRLVLSALLEIDRQGDVVKQEFMRGVIRSAKRMTYTNVFRLLEGDAAMRERYHKLVERFELMRELALILNRKRKIGRAH